MQLNQTDDSRSRFGQTFRGCIELIRRSAVFLFWSAIVSIIASGVFLFGKILWGFLVMFLKAMGEF